MKNKTRLLWNERTTSAKIIDEPLKTCVFSQLIIDTLSVSSQSICTHVQYRNNFNMNIIIDTNNEDFFIFVPEYTALYSFGSFIIEFHCWNVCLLFENSNWILNFCSLGSFNCWLCSFFLSISLLSQWNQLNSGAGLYHQCNNSKWRALFMSLLLWHNFNLTAVHN